MICKAQEALKRVIASLDAMLELEAEEELNHDSYMVSLAFTRREAEGFRVALAAHDCVPREAAEQAIEILEAISSCYLCGECAERARAVLDVLKEAE